MSSKSEILDVTFIGGGPVGLYGAYYAGAHDLGVKIIDSQPCLGGRLTALYPEKTIYDVAGHPSIRAKDFVNNLIQQAESFKPEVCLGERVTDLLADDAGGYKLITNKAEHRSRVVIITAGVGAFVPEGLKAAGTEAKEGAGIFYGVDNLEQFKDKAVVVVGAGDNALEWALKLRDVAKSVTLVHRLNKLDTGGDFEGDLSSSGVELKFPYYEIKEIHGDKKIEAVTFINTSTGEEERRVVDALVLNVGFLVNLSEFQRWGIELSGNSIGVNERMETSLPGVFAAGDIVTHAGKIKLISTGAGEVAIAVNSAAAYLERSKSDARRKAAGAERVMAEPGRFFSGFEALQVAAALMKEGIDFYSLAFFRSEDQDVKQFFAKLQREGYDMLRKLQEEILPQAGGAGYAVEDLDGTAIVYLRDSIDPSLFGGYNLARSFSAESESDLGALYTAIRIHEDNIRFFRQLASEKNLAQVKEALEEMVDIEKRHIGDIREMQQEAMNSTGRM